MIRNLVYGCLYGLLVFLDLSCVGCGKQPVEPAVAQSQPETPSAQPEPESTSETPESTAIEPELPAAEEPSEPTGEPAAEEPESEPAELPRLPAPEGATAMPEPNLVWIDPKQGIVMVDGYISLQDGMLEMFACPVGTKEHESIVAVESSAQVVHAALLAVGAKAGTPVQFDPEFKPPTGTEIEIEVRWQDEAGEWQSTDARQWITDIKTEQPMAHPWVFAGSEFYQDEETGDEYYLAEMGDFICVSNFSTATLDIPVESSQVNEGLLFEANAAKIPPLGTPVRLVLKPKLEKGAE